MKNLKKNLRNVNREINALTKKVDRMIVSVEKLEKSKPKIVKAKPAKKVAAKKPAVKKTVQLSAIDTVFGFIKRSKKGVDTATLINKTGFVQKKIFNIVYKLKKQGKIKSEKKGVYMMV